VERGLKQAENLNAGSIARQALISGASSVDRTESNRRNELRKGRDDEAPAGHNPVTVDSVVTEEVSARSDEDVLIETSLAGNEDAFEQLVRRHSPRVFSIIGSFFRRRDLIEDIAQEVFAKAYFSLGTFTLGRSFEAWVAKIAVNACYDHLRAQRRRIDQQLPHETQQEDEWFELQMLEVARDRHASAERQRDASEIAERLLSKLDPEDRMVVVLIDRDGFSVKEVAEMTGWGQSKVKVRAFRARRVLRAAMKRLVLSGERMQRSKNK
jgi:RNA polymerase sigma-70 factor (ECF subfamily)